MGISSHISIPKNGLPDTPGVYRMKNAVGEVLYVGKAAHLRRRVASYWGTQEVKSRAQIADLLLQVRSIEITETASVLEALILEANEIKRFQPKYNVLLKDNKSFLYLCLTKDVFPRPLLIRGHDLAKTGEGMYRSVFGPYLSGASLRIALDLVRKIFPWSTCFPHAKRACFSSHIGLCPGVCTDRIPRAAYLRSIRHIELFFSGKKERLVRQLEKEMHAASRAQEYEIAAARKKQLDALAHIHDVALLKRDDSPFIHPLRPALAINVLGRVEAYDLSHISGTSAVGSMTVFEHGEPAKNQYRRFRLKRAKGGDDYDAMREVLTRRCTRALGEDASRWPLPDLFVIDGGEGQVKIAGEVFQKFGLSIPYVGIAKGPNRKQDRMVFDRRNRDLAEVVAQYRTLLQRVRDEAHRFAVSYHRVVRAKKFLE